MSYKDYHPSFMRHRPRRIVRNSPVDNLMSLGVSYEEDATALRRISMTLHRWHELECGTDAGCIEREGEDGSGRPRFRSMYSINTGTGKGYLIPDREAGALKRLGKIMARYPSLGHYVQGDPRGAALYILRPGDVPPGENADAYYSRGIAVYK